MRAAASGSTRREQAVQARVAVAPGHGLEAAAQGLVARRALEEPLEQGAQVEAGAPHHEGQAPARRDVAHRGPSLARVLGGREVLGGIGHVQEVVRDQAPLVGASALALPMSRPR